MSQIHRNVPNADYQSWDMCSNSRLNLLLKSPAHLRYQIDHPEPPTPAMVLGDAVDCLVFTPESFQNRFSTPKQCVSLTKKGERCQKLGNCRHKGEWFCYTHHDPTNKPDDIKILSEEDYERVQNIAQSVKSHPTTSALLSQCDDYQLSLTWDDAGLPCKCRFDGYSSSLKTIVDLKTTVDASPGFFVPIISEGEDSLLSLNSSFSRSVLNYGYHRQAAMYLRAAEKCGLEAYHFIFIAVEKEPPYAVAVYKLSDAAIDYGKTQLLRLMDCYAECIRSGNWPSYPENVMEIGLPSWVKKVEWV